MSLSSLIRGHTNHLRRVFVTKALSIWGKGSMRDGVLWNRTAQLWFSKSSQGKVDPGTGKTGQEPLRSQMAGKFKPWGPNTNTPLRSSDPPWLALCQGQGRALQRQGLSLGLNLGLGIDQRQA
jgi:hypothetical protein